MTMYRGSKFFGGNRKREESLLQKAVLTFLVTGVIAWPSFSPVYAASEYVRIDGGTNVTKGKVTDIYVGKMSSDNKTGVNVFQKFNVEKGDIANLRFNQKDQNVHANNLLNMVQDKININGTVNALRNGKIGGNLYFISSNGMAVGSSGAINAGSLTVMTPAQDFFKYINKEKKKVKFYEVDKDGKRVKDAEGKDKVKEEEKEVDVTYNIFTKQYSYKSDETDDAKDGGIKTEFNGGTKEDDSKYGWAHKLKISGEDKNLNDLWLAGTMDGKEVSEKNLSRENMMVKAAVPLNASGSIVVLSRLWQLKPRFFIVRLKLRNNHKASFN